MSQRRFPHDTNFPLHQFSVFDMNRTFVVSYLGYGVSLELCVFSGAVEDTERNSVSYPEDLMGHSLHVYMDRDQSVT